MLDSDCIKSAIGVKQEKKLKGPLFFESSSLVCADGRRWEIKIDIVTTTVKLLSYSAWKF